MKLLYLLRQPPRRGALAQEGLDAVLMGSAFAECTVIFTGDGLWQLVADQAPEAVGGRNFSLSFAALPDYGVTALYCSAADLDSRQLTVSDLVIPVTPLSDAAIRDECQNHSQVFTF